jgi:hypothetical protein
LIDVIYKRLLYQKIGLYLLKTKLDTPLDMIIALPRHFFKIKLNKSASWQYADSMESLPTIQSIGQSVSHPTNLVIIQSLFISRVWMHHHHHSYLQICMRVSFSIVFDSEANDMLMHTHEAGKKTKIIFNSMQWCNFFSCNQKIIVLLVICDFLFVF